MLSSFSKHKEMSIQHFVGCAHQFGESESKLCFYNFIKWESLLGVWKSWAFPNLVLSKGLASTQSYSIFIFWWWVLTFITVHSEVSNSFSSLRSIGIFKGHCGKPAQTQVFGLGYLIFFVCVCKMCCVFKMPLKKLIWVQEWWDRLMVYKFLQSCSVQGNTDPSVTIGLAETAGGGGTQCCLWTVKHTFAFNSV